MTWSVVLCTFITLFLAELGDKTQLAVFTLSSQTRAPWSVFLGASLALILSSLMGAFLGKIIADRVPIFWVHIGAGGLFIAIGCYVLFQTLRG